MTTTDERAGHIWELIAPEGLDLSYVRTRDEAEAERVAMRARIAAEYSIPDMEIDCRRITRAEFVRAWGEDAAVEHYDRIAAGDAGGFNEG